MIDLRSLLISITDIGDSAVLGTIVLAISAYLLAKGARKEAVVVLLSFLVASLMVSLVKILLMGCGSSLRHWGLRSPSGHTALSLSVFGMLALLLSGRLKGKKRMLPFLLLIPMALLIAYTRVALGFHSAAEVCAGLIIGGMMLLPIRASFKNVEATESSPVVIIIITLFVAIMLHGVRLPAENIIALIASHFKNLAHCV